MTTETVGKTLDEAVEDALRQFDATRDEVDVEILDVGSKGFLGFGAKPCRVRVTKQFQPEKAAERFLSEVAAKMGIVVKFDIKFKDRDLYIEIIGDDVSFLIGKHGHTLDALQYLTNLAINKGETPFVNIFIDSGGYREKRKETLENLARNLAKKVKMTKRSVRLEPMSSSERRIIHAALSSDKSIYTHSDGDEPNRNVVISLRRNNHKELKNE
ncbi:DNA-binding protein [Clostridia bacterium]|nr:DNA-binding protein [Clostridia bacterium]